MSEYIYATQGKPMRDEDGLISLPREEIVRCCDCGNRFVGGNCIFIYEYGYEPNFFCANGEREEA